MNNLEPNLNPPMPKDKGLRSLLRDHFEFARRRIEIIGLRRNGAELSNSDENTIIQAQDTVVIKGKPRRVERVERVLLTG